MKSAITAVLCVILAAGMLGMLFPVQQSAHAPTGQAVTLPQKPVSDSSSHPAMVASGSCSNYDDEVSFANNATVTFNPYANLAEINTDGSVPAGNVVSQYARSIYVTVTPVKSAHFNNVFLTVWGTGWNNQTLTSTLPTAPGIWPLLINQTTGVATGMLNDMKYFPPGSTVYFNITVYSQLSGNMAVYSPCPAGATKVPIWGNATYPTWAYTVGGGWPSPIFTSDIKITAFPNVFDGIEPGIFQPVQLTISSISGSPIGGANVNYTLTIRNITTGSSTTEPGTGSEYANGFTPVNSSTETSSLGPFQYSPYNVTIVNFHIIAWELWSGGVENTIDSYISSGVYYSYTVSSGGTLCGQNQSWAQDVTVTTTPYANISTPGSNVQIKPMSDIINVTVETIDSNVTLSYAFIFYNDTYQGKTITGELLMTAYNSTTQYSGNSGALGANELGPYLPGIQIRFYISVTDTLHCTISSPVYGMYTPPGPPPVVNNKTFFYVLAFDEGLGTYAVGAQVIFGANGTVICITQTNALGFAYPNITGSSLPLYLAMNENYNVTVIYDGSVQTAYYLLTMTSNKTLTFYFDTSQSAPVVYALSAPAIDIPLIAGLVAASATVIPIYLLWREMRIRAKEEEKRITL
jgi:hypothetical protein